MRAILTSALIATMALPAAADDLALVLGIERYDNVADVSGGDDVLSAVDDLRELGVEVFRRRDASQREFRGMLGRFARQSAEADRIIVVLSGRFVTDGERTWYLAQNADRPDSVLDAGDRAISVDSVIKVLSGAPERSLLLIGRDSKTDRIDEWLRFGPGGIEAPRGVAVIVGNPEEIGDFLVDVVAEPGADLAAAVAQRDGIASRGYMPDRFVLFREEEEARADRGDRPRTDCAREDARRPEYGAFAEAVEADDEAAYRRYLDRFPCGIFAVQARIALDRLQDDPQRRAREIEDRLDLDRNQRREIQRDFSVLGYNTRGIDGLFGPGTRRVIQNWQQQNGLEQTSFLTGQQIARLDGQAERRRAELEVEAERQRQAQIRRDKAYWSDTGAQGNEAGYRAYLERFPDGEFADTAETELTRIAERKRDRARAEDRRAWDAARRQDGPGAYRSYLRSFPQGAFEEEARARLRTIGRRNETRQEREGWQAEENRLGLNAITRRLIEQSLADVGLNPGAVDGSFNNGTRRALRQYQRARNLDVTGFMNEATAVRLLADSVGFE